MNIQFDIQPAFQKFVINRMLPLDTVFDFLGIDYSIGSNMYCPFHDDSNHPSAKYFTSEDGVGSVWCFSEQRMYFSSHAISLLTRKNLDTVFYELWKGVSDLQKEYLLSIYDKPLEVMPTNWSVGKSRLSPFEKGAMSYHDYLDNFIIAVTGEERSHV